MFKIQFYEENAGIKIIQMLSKFICMCTHTHTHTQIWRGNAKPVTMADI